MDSPNSRRTFGLLALRTTIFNGDAAEALVELLSRAPGGGGGEVGLRVGLSAGVVAGVVGDGAVVLEVDLQPGRLLRARRQTRPRARLGLPQSEPNAVLAYFVLGILYMENLIIDLFQTTFAFIHTT